MNRQAVLLLALSPIRRHRLPHIPPEPQRVYDE